MKHDLCRSYRRSSFVGLARASRAASALAFGVLALACSGRLEVLDGPDSGVVAPGASCSDGVLGGSETDVDCGGECGGCGEDQRCAQGSDCRDGVCRDGICQPADCEDGIQNGDETGVDCGNSCADCVSDRCSCASSDALVAIGCDLGVAGAPQMTTVGARAPVSSDARSLAYEVCDAAGGCTPYSWSLGAGSTRVDAPIGGAHVAGLSGDGNWLLLSPTDELSGGAYLVPVVGDPVSVATGLLTNVLFMTESGAVLGVFVNQGGETRLARLPRGGELEDLGALPGDPNAVSVAAATSDASVVIGSVWSGAGGAMPFRVVGSSLALGAEALPEPELANVDAGASADAGSGEPAPSALLLTALSRDGRVVAGIARYPSAPPRAFVWSEAEGRREVATATSGGVPGIDPNRLALSDDGAVVVGTLDTDPGEDYPSAYRYAGELVQLTPGTQSDAQFISGDGSLVIGRTVEPQPYVWTATAGARSLVSLLRSAGVDVSGWDLNQVLSLSSDGRVVVGAGSCGGAPSLYRIELPR